MLNADCRAQRRKRNTLIVKPLLNCAKNCVFAANVCVVEKKRVDWAIECLPFFANLSLPHPSPLHAGVTEWGKVACSGLLGALAYRISASTNESGSRSRTLFSL